MNRCLIVMYHYVRDTACTEFPSIRALSPGAFVQQLDWLGTEHRIIDMETLQAAVEGRAALPSNAALLTFDDGFVDHYATVFPALRARGLSGVFFLSDDACAATRLLGVHKTHFLLARLGATAFADAVLAECRAAGVAAGSVDDTPVFGIDTWERRDERAVKRLLNYELPFAVAEQVLDALFVRHIGDPSAFAGRLYLDAPMIRDMARAGMIFGYHTRSHRMLSRLSPIEQADELRGGVEWIRSLTGQRSVPFCYPWGGAATYSAETVRLLEEAGFSLAFNTVRRQAAIGVDPRFELPRFDTRDLPPHGSADDGGVPGMAEEA